MNIKLVPVDNIGIDLLKKWQNENDIKYPLMGFRFPIQKGTVEDWLLQVKKDNATKRVIYGIQTNKSFAGIISLNNIDYINRSAFFGVFVADKKKNNKGIASESSKIILDFAFNSIGLNRVELEVLISNKNAIHLYEKLGFKNEGIKRAKFFADNKFHDVKIMSILKSEFKTDKNKIKNRLIFNFRKYLK